MNRFKIYLKFNKKLYFDKVHDQVAVTDTKIHFNQLKLLLHYLN